jgi:hypothetical protein
MPKKRVCLYITDSKWNKFIECCIREGAHASSKIEEEYIDPYLATHGEGNPQTLLDYAGLPKTLPHWKTCRYSSGQLWKGLFTCYHPTDGYSRITPKTCDRRNERVSCYQPTPELQVVNPVRERALEWASLCLKNWHPWNYEAFRRGVKKWGEKDPEVLHSREFKELMRRLEEEAK